MSVPVLLLAPPVIQTVCFPYCSPDGPSTPFDNPMFVALDVLRIACIVFAAIAVIATPTIMRCSRTWGQRSRFASQALWAIVAANTELEHLGDVASPRLVLNLLASALAAAGTWSFYRREYGTTGCATSPDPARGGP